MEEVLKSVQKRRRLLVVVDADPRTNPRAAEALRMAGGVSVWEQVELHVVLCGPASRAVGEGASALPDAKIFAQFIPMIRQQGGRVHVLPDEEAQNDVAVNELVKHQLNPEKLPELAAGFDSVLRF